MFRKIMVILFGTVLLTISFSYFVVHPINLLTWVNSLFYCSLLLTIIGGAMLVLQGGFFNGMVRSFKRFLQKSNYVEQVLDEIEGTREDVSPYSLTFTLTIPFLFAGVLLVLFSIIFSWVVL